MQQSNLYSDEGSLCDDVDGASDVIHNGGHIGFRKRDRNRPSYEECIDGRILDARRT